MRRSAVYLTVLAGAVILLFAARGLREDSLESGVEPASVDARMLDSVGSDPAAEDAARADGPALAMREPAIDPAAEILAEIAPVSVEHFPGETATLLDLFRGDIGVVDAAAVSDGIGDSVEALLISLAPLTGATDDLEVEISHVRRNSNQYSVDFRQVINGIPVDRLQRVSFDRNGVVSRLSSTLLRPATAVNDVQVLADEAAVHALTAVAVELGTANTVTSFSDPETAPELVFKFVDHNEPPDLAWEFLVATSQRTPDYKVVVDARTGEARVYENAFYWNTRVCQNSDPAARDCDPDSPTTTPVYEENAAGERECVGGDQNNALCGEERFQNPWDVMGRLEDFLKTNAPEYCCDGVGGENGHVDIIVDGGLGPMATPEGAILLPHPDGQPPWYEPTQYALEDQVLVHEGAHVVQHTNNPTLTNAAIEDDVAAGAIMEGAADAIAGLYGEAYGLPDPWVMKGFENADYPTPVSTTRDLTQPQIWQDQGEPFPNIGPWGNGMTIGHYIYLLRQEGASIEELVDLVTEAVSTVTPTGGGNPSQFDIDDYRHAMNQAAIGNQSLLQKMVAASALMSGEIGSNNDPDDYVCEDCEESQPHDPPAPPPDDPWEDEWEDEWEDDDELWEL